MRLWPKQMCISARLYRRLVRCARVILALTDWTESQQPDRATFAISRPADGVLAGLREITDRRVHGFSAEVKRIVARRPVPRGRALRGFIWKFLSAGLGFGWFRALCRSRKGGSALSITNKTWRMGVQTSRGTCGLFVRNMQFLYKVEFGITLWRRGGGNKKTSGFYLLNIRAGPAPAPRPMLRTCCRAELCI